jgi:2-polyprenyl-6-methoxyphenol hydroxylase-like FAD-dependent oxidoreductase
VASEELLPPRDFVEDTPLKLHGLCIFHPRMQQAMLQAAQAAGAEVWRGASVRQAEPGHEPKVLVERGADTAAIAARLVVGADGRSSMVRRWGGFESRNSPSGNLFTGVLVENVPTSAESSVCMDEKVTTKLSHQRKHLDVLGVRQRRFLIEPESSQLTNALVQSRRGLLRVEV